LKNFIKKLEAIVVYEGFPLLIPYKKFNIRFWNQGLPKNTYNLSLKPEDVSEQNPIQLYHHLLKDLNVKGKNILEVGCGRGGGCYYAKEYLEVNHVSGLDLSYRHIKICRSWLSSEKGYDFKQGNALQLPYHEESFDAIVNLESAQYYTSLESFFKECHRVLKKDGVLSIACVIDSHVACSLEKLLLDAHFKIIKKENLTSKILISIEQEEERKETIRKQRRIPKRLMLNQAVMVGSDLYKKMQEGLWEYPFFLVQKS